MNHLQAITFGALQGLSEFLPISSSGHLVLLKNLFGLENVPRLFDVLLHGATLLVIFFVFRRRIGELLSVLGRFMLRRSAPGDAPGIRIIGVLLLATVFTGVLGMLIKDLGIEAYPKAVSALFLVTAAVLILTRRFDGRSDEELPGVKEAAIIGIAQGIGVLPGISRSGITISAALFAGMNRKEAGEFSFLLAIPAIMGALVLSLKDARELTLMVSPGVLLSGLAAATLVGYISLRLLLRMIRGGRLYLFALYLIPLGLSGLFFL